MGDFGLAEDIHIDGYFKQERKENIKLPFKWMALESLIDGIFTEKTDVVYYNITQHAVHEKKFLVAISRILMKSLPIQH